MSTPGPQYTPGENYRNPGPEEVGYRPIPQSPPPRQYDDFGQPQYSPYGQPVVINNATGNPFPTSGMAVAAIILGLVGIGLSWFTFAIPSILAIIFGFVGLKQTSAPNVQGRGLALTGLISGGAILAIMILLWVLFFFGVFGTALASGY